MLKVWEDIKDKILGTIGDISTLSFLQIKLLLLVKEERF